MYASNKKYAGQAIASSLPRASPEEQEIKHWDDEQHIGVGAPTGEVPSNRLRQTEKTLKTYQWSSRTPGGWRKMYTFAKTFVSVLEKEYSDSACG